jgi:hypothetical protein
MRVVRFTFGVLMLSGAAAVACGGDDNSTPGPGSGGKSGSAGKGGTAGNAGTLSTTGGTAGTGGSGGGAAGSAGSGTAGSAGVGGSAGSAGSAGSSGMVGDAGMNSGGESGGSSGEACPPSAPEDGDQCDNEVNPGGGDDPCTYMSAGVETTCTCSGFMDPSWNCESLTCPGTAPADGDPCDPEMNPSGNDDPCAYDMLECTCDGGGGGPGGNDEWSCAAPPMCPDTEPTDGDDCDTDMDPGTMDGGCVFGMTTCVCQGGGGGGMQQWNCGTCPATEPEGDCDNEVNAFCSYGDTTCTCGFTDEWDCD